MHKCTAKETINNEKKVSLWNGKNIYNITNHISDEGLL